MTPPDERDLLFRALESDNFMVVGAANGREAPRILTSDPATASPLAGSASPSRIASVTIFLSQARRSTLRPF
jgi:hypothetical protein